MIAQEVFMADNDAVRFLRDFSKRDIAQTPGILQPGLALVLGSTRHETPDHGTQRDCVTTDVH